MKVIFSFLLLILFLSCSEKKADKGIIPPSQMGDLLWEQMKINAFTTEFMVRDSSKNLTKENLILQEKIFQKYHTTKEQFYKSYDYYLDHSAELKVILDSVTAKQSRLKERNRLQNIRKLKEQQ